MHTLDKTESELLPDRKVVQTLHILLNSSKFLATDAK